MLSWLSGIFGSILATLLLAGATTVLTWVRKTWPQYGDLARYWITTFAALAIIVYATTGYVPFAKHEPTTSADNIAENVKMWCENLGLSIAKVALPDAYFGYTVTTLNGNPIQVGRSTKEKSAYLQFVETVNPTADQQPIIGKLTQDQLDMLTQEMAVELNKSKIGFAVSTVSIPQIDGKTQAVQVAVLQKALPISGATEAQFSNTIDDLNFAAQLIHSETAVSLKRLTIARAASAGTKITTQN